MSHASPAEARVTGAAIVIPGTSRVRHPPTGTRLESTS